MMSRLAIVLALALAATAAHAQGAPSRPSHAPAANGANAAQPASRLDHTQPFLFDGRMKGDGERRGPQADHRRANTGAIVVQPDAGQPARP